MDAGREAGRLLGARGGALAALSRVAAVLAVILVPLVLVLVVLLPLLRILVHDSKQKQKQRKRTMRNRAISHFVCCVFLVSWLTC